MKRATADIDQPARRRLGGPVLGESRVCESKQEPSNEYQLAHAD
jgi:hypothetical protein